MINRRQSLGLMAGVVMAAKAPGTEMEADTGVGVADDPRAMLQALMKLRASVDDRLTLEWFKGVVYGVVDAALTPLFSLNAVAFASFEAQDDSSFLGRRIEVVYHGDLATGERISEFRNPYNGKLMAVPLSRTPLQPVTINTNGLMLPAQLGPLRIEAESELGPAISNGGRTWIRLDTRSRMFPPNAQQPAMVYNESISYTGSSADLETPEKVSVPSQISYYNLMSWRPWMMMDGVAGHSISIAAGEKVWQLAELPADLRQFVAAEHPDLAADALAVLTAEPPGAG